MVDRHMIPKAYKDGYRAGYEDAAQGKDAKHHVDDRASRLVASFNQWERRFTGLRNLIEKYIEGTVNERAVRLAIRSADAYKKRVILNAKMWNRDQT